MLKDKLLEDLKSSMRDKNVLRKNVIQLIRAGILQVEKDNGIVVDDNKIIEIIAKEVKSRKDALKEFEKAERQDLIDQTNEEIKILEEYLPEQLSREEIEEKLKNIISNLGATSMKDMGPIMKEAKSEMGASADGRIINEIAKELLN